MVVQLASEMESPTTWPLTLIAFAELQGSVPMVPKSTICPTLCQSAAWK